MASVLVVEDDPAVRRLGAAVLRAAGHQALQAAAVSEALAVLEDLGSAVDLVISDLGLTDGSGGRVMLLCRQLRPQATVLFMTVGKPFRPARPIEAVHRALDETDVAPR